MSEEKRDDLVGLIRESFEALVEKYEEYERYVNDFGRQVYDVPEDEMDPDESEYERAREDFHNEVSVLESFLSDLAKLESSMR
jgi:hypothetical protein